MQISLHSARLHQTYKLGGSERGVYTRKRDGSQRGEKMQNNSRLIRLYKWRRGAGQGSTRVQPGKHGEVGVKAGRVEAWI